MSPRPSPYNRSRPTTPQKKNEDDITVAEILRNGDKVNENRSVICQIVVMQPPTDDDKKVVRKRRRIVLADHTDTIVAFVMRTKSARLIEGESIDLSNFRVGNRCITIHDKSVLST